MMNRRAVLMVPIGLALAATADGCSFLKSVSGVDMTAVAADVSTVAGFVKAMRASWDALTVVPQSVRDTVDKFVDNALSMASNVKATISSVAAQPFVTRLEDDIKAAWEFAKPYLPSSAGDAFSAASVLLTAVKTIIGIVGLVPLAPTEADVAAARVKLQQVAMTGRL